ncbi:fimbrial-like protein YadL [Escherichia sp. E4742]|uniref:fimbrial-like protein YadL n=1 Tax=Escherichia sp. E4742 TaxID=2044467 RepID=UPI001081B859|nr:fimbrial-like protein YadL [Escherichia sp. E4742]QCT90347.1 fimbrial-like protein YadL [Escherichia sp. E4742]TGB54820.1 fimbrial protein StaE [Escherichia sp. E4742]TLJ09579.1 fimbrial-like protein YadL [Escherichia sp. E4742]
MMIYKKLRSGLSIGLALTVFQLTIPVYAATDSIGLTVLTTVEMGTCTAKLVNDSNQDITAVEFGDVYISEINAKSKIKTFKLQFKDCAGIPGKKAQIKLTKRATCEGTSNDGPGFANGSTGTGQASAVAVEVWSTTTPAVGSATQFSCVAPANKEVTIATATGNNVVDYPMSARLVVEKDNTASNVTAGTFSAPATFTVTYN